MADLKLTISIKNLDRVRAAMQQLSGPQLSQAIANAMNDTAYKARNVMKAELVGKFDRVTPWVANSPKFDPATLDKLRVHIAPTHDTRRTFQQGGKAGVDPQDVLQAQEHGGYRRDKKSEAVLRRAGILPRGLQTVIPRTPYPGSVDAYGNLRGAFVQQLLSYFQTFGEQGFKANMSARRKAALHKGTAKKAGVRYFVSQGRYRDATRHLAEGIWAASGTHGVDVRPVLMFVYRPHYTPRISMERVANNAGLQDYLDKRIRYRIRNLAEGKRA